MLEVEFGLLSNGSIGVKGRLDAVPQHAHVHGRNRVSSVACCVPVIWQTSSRGRCGVGGASAMLSSKFRPAREEMGGSKYAAETLLGRFWVLFCAPCGLHPACAGSERRGVQEFGQVRGHAVALPARTRKRPVLIDGRPIQTSTALYQCLARRISGAIMLRRSFTALSPFSKELAFVGNCQWQYCLCLASPCTCSPMLTSHPPVTCPRRLIAPKSRPSVSPSYDVQKRISWTLSHIIIKVISIVPTTSTANSSY